MTTYQSTAFLCAIVVSWLICQSIKFILSLKQKPKDKSFVSYFLFVATKMGGVVSSHSVLVSSLISSLIVAIIRIGYDPGSLIITLIIGVIIIRDAKERHSIKEIFLGILLGAIFSTVFSILFIS